MTMSPPESVPPALEYSGPVRPASAIRHASSHSRLWIVAILGVVADLWSKQWAFSSIPMGVPQPIFDSVLSFRLSLNPGALFGMGAGLAPIFVGASVLALLFVLYLFSQSTPRHRFLHIALGLVLAGAVGNLYDRTQVLATVVETVEGRRDVGTQVARDANQIVLADFQTGTNPRSFALARVTSITQQPVVRDFISIDAQVFGYRVWPWIFNVADIMLVVGVGILLISFWSEHRGHRKEEPQMSQMAQIKNTSA